MLTTNPTQLTRNVLKVWRSATPEQRQAGADWYTDARRVSRALAADAAVDIATAAGVIAATSPLMSWGANVNLASRVLETWATTGEAPTTGYLRDGLRKCQRLLDGEAPDGVLTSRKVNNFFHAIMGEANAVCVDRHAHDVAVGMRMTDQTRPGLTPKRYDMIANAYRRAAEIASAESGQRIDPTTIQATTWLVWRQRRWAAGAWDAHAVATRAEEN